MEKNDVNDLIRKYIDRQLTTAERDNLYNELVQENNRELLDAVLLRMDNDSRNPVSLSDDVQQGLFARIMQADKPQIVRMVPVRSKWRWIAAAVVLVIIGASIWIFMPQQKPQNIVQEIQPGSPKATLTLADGSIVQLDSTGHQLLLQGNTSIRQTGGQLAYDVQSSTGAISYNTLATPRGGQFRLILPDGSVVWLNAASTIRYPTVFNGKERRVEVTGEAYFEVAKNTEQPFRIEANGRTAIEVLGTAFNVNAYTNEASLNTTLVEGAVRVTAQHNSVVLHPGEQAQVAGDIKVLKDADIEKITAWKNGVFNFEDARLEEVMRQIERWYDVDVVYEKGIPDLQFWGKLSRDLNLNELLAGLKRTGVNFRQEGRKLIVIP